MSTPYVGEIRMFGGNFAPAGWMTCDGQTIPISENDTLFNLIGTTYGGDGQNTFQLPNLAGKVPVHMGNSRTGTNYPIGSIAGVPSVTLNVQQMANHNHPVVGATGGPVTSPANAFPGTCSGGPTPNIYGNTSPGTNFNPATIQGQGGSQPHENMQPYLAITFIISMFGIFPSQS
ncbi:MAG TPA: tail fiber protein [Xanthobacteraceae bacterium]|jgi:microcystin-dependent protein